LIKILKFITGLGFTIVFTVSTFSPKAWGAELESSLGLGNALRATLSNHPAVKGKQAEVNAQSFVIDSAKAARYPTLSLQANTLDDEFAQSSVRLQQPIFSFGKINTAIEQARSGFKVELLDLQQVQRQLLEDTAAAYALVEGINRREQVAIESINQHEELFDRIVRRKAGQLATEADVQLANSRLIQARTTQIKTTGELQIALSELRALTQVNVDSNVPVDLSLIDLPSRLQVERLALEHSADVLLKRERVKVAKLDIKLAKVASRPTLSFRVEHSFSDSLVNVEQTRTGLVFESSFDGLGFHSRARTKGAMAKWEAAQYDLDATMSEVRLRANILMENRQVQENLIQAQGASVVALTSTLESFIRQYEVGLKSWVEVLNTQRELTGLRMQLSQMETEHLVLSLRVAALIGNLDEQAGINTL